MDAQRVGFVIDGRVPGIPGVAPAHCGWSGLLCGCPSTSSIAVMRFGWLAANNPIDSGTVYELFRPWRHYAAVIFLKSMNNPSISLVGKLKQKGTITIFDANVDYFTTATGIFYYSGMEPNKEQQDQACTMAQCCHAVIADSEHISEKAKSWSQRVEWIPDNVNMDLVPNASADADIFANGKLKLLWSGEAVKLFELLCIENVLRHFAKHIKLVVVTSDIRAIQKWHNPYKKRFEKLTAELDVTIIPFRSIRCLFSIYRQGGVFISPRFLDNSYNLGHSEWKITLPMACEVPVLCSPQPSYLTVRKRGGGVRICTTDEDWVAAVESLLSASVDCKAEGHFARQTVIKYYSSKVIARQHSNFVRSLLEV